MWAKYLITIREEFVEKKMVKRKSKEDIINAIFNLKNR